MTTAAHDGAAHGTPVRLGRKRDHSRDEAILDAAIEVLGEVGYPSLTIDAVALRARAGKATLYRRWSSKEELVVDAVERIKRQQVPLDPLPDTGTVRGDLLALFRPQTDEEIERRDRAAAGLASMLADHPPLARAAHSALVDPWADAHRSLMTRAVERGEVAPTVDVETLCRVLPTLAAYRALVQRDAFDERFLLSVVDGLLMPALLYERRTAPTG
jgi:AcrR family transcriptional regulator